MGTSAEHQVSLPQHFCRCQDTALYRKHQFQGMQGHPVLGCALHVIGFLLLGTATLQLPTAAATKFVANPAARLSHEHRTLIEELWKVSSFASVDKAAYLQTHTCLASSPSTWHASVKEHSCSKR